MSPEIIKSMDSILDHLSAITTAISDREVHAWWDTQWFASLSGALVGVIGAVIVGEVRDYLKWRKKTLTDWYEHIVENQNPDEIFEIAQMTYYGHTSTANGITTVIPEKSMSERVIIQFRRRYKYWNLPWSRLRFLLWRYEKKLQKLPDIKMHKLILDSNYTNAKHVFDAIVELAEKQTGENQWTVRD